MAEPLGAVLLAAAKSALKKKATKKVIAAAASALTIIGAFALMFFIGFLGTSGGADIEAAEDVVESEDGKGRMPVEIYELMVAAGRSTGVPWTIYAAIAESATDYGQKSPYDSHNRRAAQEEDPEQIDVPEEDRLLWFPQINPPIGDPAQRQGLGPLLIWPELAAEYPDLDPQNWEDAVEIVGTEMLRLMEEAEESGNPRPDPPEPVEEGTDEEGGSVSAVSVGSSEYDQWWISILDQLRAGRTPNQTPAINCGIDDTTTVALAVSVLFRCAIAEHGGAYAVTGTSQTPDEIRNGVDPTALEWTEGIDARERIVEDAVSLVYNWVGDDLWRQPIKTAVGPGCENNTDGGSPDDAAIAPQRAGWRGVFPLSGETAESAGVESPCNAVDALRKVADTVAAGAAVRPDERPSQTAIFDGWAWHHLAVGDPAARERYTVALAEKTSLPTQPTAAYNSACLQAWDRYFWGATQTDVDEGRATSVFEGVLDITAPLAGDVGAHPDDETIAEIAAQLYADNPNGMSDVAAQIEEVRTKAGLRDICGYARMTDQIQAANLLELREEEARRSMLEEMHHTAEGEVGSGDAGLLVWYRYQELVKVGGAEHQWYTHAGAARFADAAVQPALAHPEPEPTPSATLQSAGWGQQIIAAAVGFGGVYVGDTRKGAQIVGMGFTLALIADNSCGPREGSSTCNWAPDGTIGGGPYDYLAWDNADGRSKAADGLMVPIGAFATTERCAKVGAGPWDEYRYTAAPMAHRFAAMCDAAAADGVHLSGASVRMYSTQESLWLSRGCNRGPCHPQTAAPGRSFHQWGLAIDMDMSPAVYDWMHSIVGCYTGPITEPSPEASYRALASPISPKDYVADPACEGAEIPVKRANTFGLVFAVGCDGHRDLRDAAQILCKGNKEDWHVQIGVPLIVHVPAGGALNAQSVEECYHESRDMPVGPGVGGDRYDTNMVAAVVHAVFECVGRNSGLAQMPPTKTSWTANGRTYTWDGAAQWGFTNFAEQAAAEAIVVSYCESLGYQDWALTGNNFTGKYGGVFQMGDWQMQTYGKKIATNKFDPYDNIWAAANYFIHEIKRGNPWGGWGPWAVVNTDYGGANVHVKVPALPRFPSSRSGYVGQQGPELPQWAAQFGSVPVPEYAGCPNSGGNRSWPQ